MNFNPKDLLIESGYNTTELKRLETISSLDRSYFSEALGFVSECDSIMSNATRVFYKSLLEADVDDMVTITESFVDFKDTVSGIIDKFLKFIKSLFERFITFITGLVKGDKHLKKHKNDFVKFSTEHEFNIRGFEYTFSPGIPALTPVEELQNIASNFFSKNNIGGTDNLNDLTALNTQYQNAVDNNESYYDTARAKILRRVDEVVYESEYSEELYRQYRNGENERQELNVTKSVVEAAYIRFDGYDKVKSQVTKDKKSVEAAYKSLKSDLDKMGKRGIDGSNVTLSYELPEGGDKLTFTGKDQVSIVELMFKLHVDRVQQISDIHALAFAAKLDALKDCFNQDKAILYKALSRIQKTSFKEAVTEGNMIVANNVFILGHPHHGGHHRDCGDEFNYHLYKDEFEDMDDDIDTEDDFDIDLSDMDDDTFDTDLDYSVIDEDHDDDEKEDQHEIEDEEESDNDFDIEDSSEEDIEDVEEGLFFNPELDLMVEHSIIRMGGRR